MLSPAPLPAPTNPLSSLQDELRAAQQRKSDSLKRLKACANDAIKGMPPDSKTFRLTQKANPLASGTHDAVPNQAKRLEVRQAQMVAARAARQDGLVELKRTSLRAVQELRETRLLSPEELRARLVQVPLNEA